MEVYIKKHKEQSRFSPRLFPLFWQEGTLCAETTPERTDEKAVQITILHTNDLHASVDGRPDEHGKQRGGLARVATTIRRARAAGPTLVFDLGDIAFGGGTWWDIQGFEAVATLRAKAGCDLATIGNHDLEHGVAGLRELLAGGYPLVSANVHVEDADVQRHIYPAFLIEIAGWHIGVTGLTTLTTHDLISSRLLRGITLTDPRQAAMQTVAALEPLVDSIVILSHLGFHQSGPGDPDLTTYLAGSKVSLILGGHTHAALDPAPTINGITICHAGAYTSNVGEVRLRTDNGKAIEVRARLLPQDETILDDSLWTETREHIAQTFQAFHETLFPLLNLPHPIEDALNRDREWTLLARALHASDRLLSSSSPILLVPLLYVAGRFLQEEQATLAEVMTVYPNLEHLIELEISGKALKERMERQASLLFYQQARLLWIHDATELLPAQLEDQRMYSIITTELVCEGGLGWDLSALAPFSLNHNLNMTCFQVVYNYLTSQQESVSWQNG